MARTESNMLRLNTKAPNFSLTNGIDQIPISLDQVRGKIGTLVVFMCNHCPYVLHILDRIVEVCHEIKSLGISTVAICSNDIENYPQDHPKLMKKLAMEKSFDFPYLYDPTQEIALAYEAACTPDFYLFEKDLKLVYRGRFDDARPKNDNPISGQDLLEACISLSKGENLKTNQIPSLGCGIKWKPGNEPKSFSI